MYWEGAYPSGFQISIIPPIGLTNHRRCSNFAGKVTERIEQGHFDAVIGFNKMPGLDIYYAADPCYAARVYNEKGRFYRLLPRYRYYAAAEKAVFGTSSGTHILLIAEGEKEKFIKFYGTQENRFHSLPPGISRDRIAPPDAADIREKTRMELGAGVDDLLLLMVGSGFKTKGVDRTIAALANLPAGLRKRVMLFVAGTGDAAPFMKMAVKLGVGGSVRFLGGRDDVPRLLQGSDFLIHPALSENTGTVLLEAMAAGLPVLASDNCGYAFHLERARAGLLIPSPFMQDRMNKLLVHMLTCPEKKQWVSNGLEYTHQTDIFSMPEKAADIIDDLAKSRK
jgi:UDP-glucose:(heptosyl)LPS alpha-1,3-glucosyltransferase